MSVHPSTAESPFYLLYGRDAHLPTEAALSPPPQRYPLDATDYRTEFTTHMSDAWELAQGNIKKAQKHQKKYYDQQSRTIDFSPGDRVFVYMPSARSGPAWKLSRPFHGPYRVVNVKENGVEVRPVDRPQSDLIRVSLNRVRKCPAELGDEFYPRQPSQTTSKVPTSSSNNWNNRLRSHVRGRPTSQTGEV